MVLGPAEGWASRMDRRRPRMPRAGMAHFLWVFPQATALRGPADLVACLAVFLAEVEGEGKAELFFPTQRALEAEAEAALAGKALRGRMVAMVGLAVVEAGSQVTMGVLAMVGSGAGEGLGARAMEMAVSAAEAGWPPLLWDPAGPGDSAVGPRVAVGLVWVGRFS